MLKRLADIADPDSWASRLRRRRFAFFASLLHTLDGPIHILDIGGTPEFWIGMAGYRGADWRITIVNREVGEDHPASVRVVRGDALALPFASKAFDVVFSNSVIEHVGGWSDQQRMAKEVRRVAPRFFVQTPNFYFPIEPHFLFVGFQFLPAPVRAALLSRFNLGWIRRAPNYASALNEVRSIRLLTASVLRQLFPQARLYKERVAGLTKSLVAYDGWAKSQGADSYFVRPRGALIGTGYRQ